MNRCTVFVTLFFLMMTTYSLAAEEAATQRETISPQSALPALQAPAVQAPAGAVQAPQLGLTMVCPMMGGGMMSGMSGMGHNMSDGLGMKDIVQIMTMQDMLQIMTEMLKIQEQVAEGTTGAGSSRLKRDIEDLRNRTKQAITDLKSFVAEQPR